MRGQRGAAVPFVAMGLVLAAFVSALLAVFVSAVVTRRSAAAGADLAALAGAVALQHGRAGCPAAAAVAESNGVELVGCAVQGAVVTVTVRRETPRLVGRRLTVLVQARAGPRASPTAEEQVEQDDGPRLVERVVAVAALG